mmetsp:Transcript_7283/g.6432  ORF Transcript_7283/g.6432 Transcript_7283/m.6432 type:complete len:81 (-) Transcript_7283:1109-1351(-)
MQVIKDNVSISLTTKDIYGIIKEGTLMAISSWRDRPLLDALEPSQLVLKSRVDHLLFLVQLRQRVVRFHISKVVFLVVDY